MDFKGIQYNFIALNHKALLKGECQNGLKSQKRTTPIFTKEVQLPDGTRKYLRGKTQEELDEKVLQVQILVKAGVDVCSEETFGHLAQMWFDIYKKPISVKKA